MDLPRQTVSSYSQCFKHDNIRPHVKYKPDRRVQSDKVITMKTDNRAGRGGAETFWGWTYWKHNGNGMICLQSGSNYLSVFILVFSLFALYLFEYHYSYNPLSLLSYHLSSVVNMSFLHSILLLLLFSSPILPFLSLPSAILFSLQVSIAWSPPPSLKSSRECSALPSHYKKSIVQEAAQEKCNSPLPLPVMKAVEETILSPHPSPLAGQCSTTPHPLPCLTFHCLLFFQVE